jgi:hypothetical protein
MGTFPSPGMCASLTCPRPTPNRNFVSRWDLSAFHGVSHTGTQCIPHALSVQQFFFFFLALKETREDLKIKRQMPDQRAGFKEPWFQQPSLGRGPDIRGPDRFVHILAMQWL